MDEEGGVSAYSTESFGGGDDYGSLVLYAPSAFEPDPDFASRGAEVWLNVVGGGGGQLVVEDEYDSYVFMREDGFPVEIIDVPVQVPIADVLRDVDAGMAPEQRVTTISDVLRDRAAGVERAPAATTDSGFGGFGALTEVIRSFTGVVQAGAGLITATQGVVRPGASGAGVRQGVNVAGQRTTNGTTRAPIRLFPSSPGANDGLIGALGRPMGSVGGFPITPLNALLIGGLVYVVARKL